MKIDQQIMFECPKRILNRNSTWAREVIHNLEIDTSRNLKMKISSHVSHWYLFIMILSNQNEILKVLFYLRKNVISYW